MIWKLLALAAGWAEARDDLDGRLVVYRDDRHYSGQDAWRRAGQDALVGLTAGFVEMTVVAVFLAAIFVIAGAISGRL